MSAHSVIKVNNLSVSYFGKKVFENITFSVTPKQIIGIIGPNGAGKSTLIKAMIGFIPSDTGTVSFWNQSVDNVRKQLAYVPQRSSIDMDFPVLVEDVVMMGRHPHISWYGWPNQKDRDIVTKSLRLVGMNEFRKRQIGQLSGGQQQRVFIARALAQEASVLFLDEPFVGIDAVSESMIMEILKDIRDQGKTLFVVHHDLSKAENYFDSLLLLKNRLIAYGKSEEVFQVDCLREAYDGKVASFGNRNGLLVVNH
ncbi:manganese ABC transporter ATP-binding protein [Desulfuribacillus stibiiarsenatis]|uniref:Manganese ABC transporter ATP-binding protein n=1 Tax=Desulfuribacillus stibiiarsenatis TaxID=1390249 RepID=A0A1E5L9N7_9FIRM|nr:metal ABC transporter ATP-binding protein [Desulfuribacillus stibiiarsenatis]OEH86860.1 manganese ABC transporter ATP-binding protein [Desulfuribacillus stibiiarsenatis]